MTSTRYFIAVSADETNRLTVDGLGNSAAEAIADAVANAQLPSNDNPDSVRRNNGELIETHFVGQECTKALYDLVMSKGGAGLSWYRNEDGLQDVEAE